MNTSRQSARAGARLVCTPFHLIELDESLADAEVEKVYEELTLQVKQ